jgi:hypothetical protein
MGFLLQQAYLNLFEILLLLSFDLQIRRVIVNFSFLFVWIEKSIWVIADFGRMDDVNAAETGIAIFNNQRITSEEGERTVFDGAEFFGKNRVKVIAHWD